MAWVWPVASAAASVFGGLLSKSGQDAANDQNTMNMVSNQQFQERMSSTAYQRATEDMKAAGLNPMLAYSQGGASTPNGGVGNPIVNSKSPMAMAGQEMISKAAGVANVMADTKVKESQVDVNTAHTALLQEQKDTTREQGGLYNSQKHWNVADTHRVDRAAEQLIAQEQLTTVEAALVRKQIRNADSSRDLMNAQTGSVNADAMLKKLAMIGAENEAYNQQEYSYYHRNIGPFVGDASKAVNSAASAAGAFRGLRRPGPRETERHTESWGPRGNSGSSTWERSK